MNWKLILQLSTIGLAMAVGTVFFIPSHIEAAVWFAIFLFCAYWIGSHCRRRRFTHGILVGLASCVWITILHLVFQARYLAGHPRESGIIRDLHADGVHLSAAAIICITGPLSCLMFGIVIGVFSEVAGLMTKPKPVDSSSLAG